MTIHPFAVIMVNQDLNCTETAKDRPYINTKAEVDLTTLTVDQLHKLLTETNNIKDSLLNEIATRAWQE